MFNPISNLLSSLQTNLAIALATPSTSNANSDVIRYVKHRPIVMSLIC
ncbi:hypothetical protein [Gloeocapsopsis dulcis]|nr:hypothetical protein [Gloeocapsopsis dulcis]WNN92329.1 hypothetical protein P0S91_26105 [Gloeocapsopsis dulcis]